MSSTRDAQASDQNEALTGQNGPYTLRSILTADQLQQDGLEHDAFVTCVEFWNDNLYIGTSNAKVVHYVRFQASEEDPDAQASFTYAFTLQATYAENAEMDPEQPGVKQILIVSEESKVCVLCNGSLSFYALPELSPVFTTTALNHCTWIGGLDLNAERSDHPDENAATIMICQKSRLRLVAIGERPREVRRVELGGCLQTVRRGNIACVADDDSYSLLDLVELRRNPLAQISSSSPSESTELTASTATPNDNEESSTLPSNEHSSQGSPERGHGRSSSTGTLEGAMNQERRSSSSRRSASQQLDPTAANFPPRGSSLSNRSSPSRSPRRTSALSQKLRPHVVSPSENEFMFTTGISYAERGVGMFVNTDGDPVRGTLEFTRYPLSLCVDGHGMDLGLSPNVDENFEDDYVLALISSNPETTNSKILEIRRWNVDTTEPTNRVHQIPIPHEGNQRLTGDSVHFHSSNSGLRTSSTGCGVRFLEVVDILAASQLELQLSESDGVSRSLNDAKNQAKQRELGERKFISSLCSSSAHLLLWDSNCLWWVVRNPEIVILNSSLSQALDFSRVAADDWINRSLVESTLDVVRGREPSNILETLGVRDIRQKGSILLFMDILHQTLSNIMTYERDRQVTEEALLDGEVDPRILLALIPFFREEIIQGDGGIWVSNSLKSIIQKFLSTHDLSVPIDPAGSSGETILHLIKRYLLFWRRKKGDASITDEKEVFLSIDAALLHILLTLDAKSPRGPARKQSVRSELNAVVDNGIDNFDRAAHLLESHKRLYVLSRLYQSRKMSGSVLATWRRIVEGEEDAGGELVDGESEVRRYLTKIHDPKLMEEYGTWLANRNPSLGVRVFSDPNSKIKFTPEQAIEILKRRAPSAVKDFLEHLVFDNNLAVYADDLISYYLESVVTELQRSDEAREMLMKSYENYRMLRSPKPTYVQFATNLAINAEWWRSRLRLLQLLGGSHGAASKYDVEGIVSRIQAYEQELVPEMIVLNGRQGEHRRAIKLLTHGLGDFDTAVRYCLLGGSSTYSPLTGALPVESEPSRSQQEELFGQLIEEFLKIEDVGDRLKQSSQLLKRFSGWFDAGQVLTLIPDNWSVERISGFLENAFRTLLAERHEVIITNALANTDNINANYELIEKREWVRPHFDHITREA